MPMHDPLAPLLAVVIGAYRGRVGVMAWRIRRRTRALASVVPEEGVKRLLWLLFVPLVAALLAASAAATPRTAPEGAATLATLDCR